MSHPRNTDVFFSFVLVFWREWFSRLFMGWMTPPSNRFSKMAERCGKSFSFSGGRVR